jgi:hypothetical protein
MFCNLQLTTLEEHGLRYENIIEKLRRDPNARRYTFPNDACDDLAFERSEDDHSKIY